jgi:hypothetical protein
MDVPARLFLRLRPALQHETHVARLRPSTRLRGLCSEAQFDRLLAAVARPLNLTTPSLPWPRAASIPFGVAWPLGIGAAIAGAFSAPFAWHVFGFAAAMGLAGWIVRRLRGPDLRDPKFTIAWLMRRLAADNYGKLTSPPHDSRKVWNTMVDLMRAGSSPQGEIGRETLLVAEVDFFARPKKPISG